MIFCRLETTSVRDRWQTYFPKWATMREVRDGEVAYRHQRNCCVIEAYAISFIPTASASSRKFRESGATVANAPALSPGLLLLELDCSFNFDWNALRKGGDAYRRACVLPGLTKNLDHQVGRAVHDQMLLLEGRRRRDIAD